MFTSWVPPKGCGWKPLNTTYADPTEVAAYFNMTAKEVTRHAQLFKVMILSDHQKMLNDKKTKIGGDGMTKAIDGFLEIHQIDGWPANGISSSGRHKPPLYRKLQQHVLQAWTLKLKKQPAKKMAKATRQKVNKKTSGNPASKRFGASPMIGHHAVEQQPNMNSDGVPGGANSAHTDTGSGSQQKKQKNGRHRGGARSKHNNPNLIPIAKPELRKTAPVLSSHMDLDFADTNEECSTAMAGFSRGASLDRLTVLVSDIQRPLRAMILTPRGLTVDTSYQKPELKDVDLNALINTLSRRDSLGHIPFQEAAEALVYRDVRSSDNIMIRDTSTLRNLIQKHLETDEYSFHLGIVAVSYE